MMTTHEFFAQGAQSLEQREECFGMRCSNPQMKLLADTCYNHWPSTQNCDCIFFGLNCGSHSSTRCGEPQTPAFSGLCSDASTTFAACDGTVVTVADELAPFLYDQTYRVHICPLDRDGKTQSNHCAIMRAQGGGFGPYTLKTLRARRFVRLGGVVEYTLYSHRTGLPVACRSIPIESITDAWAGYDAQIGSLDFWRDPLFSEEAMTPGLVEVSVRVRDPATGVWYGSRAHWPYDPTQGSGGAFLGFAFFCQNAFRPSCPCTFDATLVPCLG